MRVFLTFILACSLLMDSHIRLAPVLLAESKQDEKDRDTAHTHVIASPTVKSSQLDDKQSQPSEAAHSEASSEAQPHFTDSANDVAGSVRDAGKADDGTGPQSPFFSGNLELRYRGRFRGGSQDNDLYQYLRADCRNLWNGKVSISGFGRAYEDLDGRESRDDVFRNILDTYSNRINGRLYYLFADVKDPVGDNSLLRLGRQYVYGAESILLDGAKYEQDLGGLEYYLFGGARTTYYGDTHLDKVAGGGAAFRPGRYTRVGLDYAAIEDDELADSFYSVSLWQTFTRDLSFFGRYTYLNTEPRDMTLKLSWDYQPWAISVQGAYFRFFNTLDSSDKLTNNFDPYTALIDSYSPFQDYKITAYKGLGEHLMLSGGIDYRDLLDDKEGNAFNREFRRYFASLILRDFFWKGLEASTGIEHWRSAEGDRNIDVTFEMTQKIGEKGEVSFGTSYNRYIFNFDENFVHPLQLDELNERIDSRVFFMRTKWKLTKSSYFSAGYQIETTDIDPRAFHTLTFTYGIDF